MTEPLRSVRGVTPATGVRRSVVTGTPWRRLKPPTCTLPAGLARILERDSSGAALCRTISSLPRESRKRPRAATRWLCGLGDARQKRSVWIAPEPADMVNIRDATPAWNPVDISLREKRPSSAQKGAVMHALRFDHFGDPHVLHITDMPDPVAGD